MTRYAMAVDIGGTFTDVVLRNDAGRTWVDKTLTTHEDLLDGFFRAVELVMKSASVGPAEVDDVIVHATTIVTNAVIERKGPRTALLVTEGFRDVLSIRDEHRYDMFDPQIEFPVPLVPRDADLRRRRAHLADGTIERDVDTAGRRAHRRGIAPPEGRRRSRSRCSTPIAIPQNEQVVRDHLRELAARDLRLAVVGRGAADPRISAHLDVVAQRLHHADRRSPISTALAEQLRARKFKNDALIMLSSGGVIGAEIAGRFPVRMIECGPAAGALAALSLRRDARASTACSSFDMGGTTAKACLIEDRKPLVAGTFEVDRMYRFKQGSGLPVLIPAIDLIEIGAGGGSIAAVDDLGLLKVGPQERRLDAGAGLLRPRRRRADRHRRRSGARLPRRRQFPRRRHEARQARGRDRHRARWPSVSAPMSAQTASGIYRVVGEIDGVGRARPRDRPRRRLSRRAAARLRRRRAGARLLCRRSARQPAGHLSAARQRALGLRHPGDAAAHGSGARRARAARRHRLAGRRDHPRRALRRRPRRSGRGRLPGRRGRLCLRRRHALFRPAERSDGDLRRRSAHGARRRRPASRPSRRPTRRSMACSSTMSTSRSSTGASP